MVSSIKSFNHRKVKQTATRNSIIKGDFPVNENLRELAIFKFNRFLSFFLVLTILAAMISYSMVIAKESILTKIHKKTNEVNFENIELQNKVDYAKSLYNINDKITKINFLKKADKVLEVKASSLGSVVEKNIDKIELQPILGY
ncbi:MAG: hypothetical protein V2B14_01205 [bacterium]